MKTGKITAKLRDAVPVCLMVEGEEVMRYKNIELPDKIKEVEMLDFHFNVHMDGKITFDIHYEEGALPETFPEARAIRRRAAKTAPQNNQTDEADEDPAPAETEPDEDAIPATMGFECTATGPRRKELVAAISGHTGTKPEYKAAPSFAYEIGAYTVDKNGTVTGPRSMALLAMLVEKGFVTPQ